MELKMPDQEIKQVIVMRKDLNMRKGKMCAQAAHASMKFIIDCMYREPVTVGSFKNHFVEYKLSTYVGSSVDLWLTGLFKKVVVYVESEEKLLSVYKEAFDSSLICSLIQDAGLTEFKGVPTYTCCAIGPDLSEEIDKITKDLPLL
jgi:peptidyl-tRNA hydrolase, PTH2 family